MDATLNHVVKKSYSEKWSNLKVFRAFSDYDSWHAWITLNIELTHTILVWQTFFNFQRIRLRNRQLQNITLLT